MALPFCAVPINESIHVGPSNRKLLEVPEG